MAAVERLVEHRRQVGPDLGAFAEADGLDQQIAQRLALELELAEHVEYLAAQGLASLLELFQQPAINIALAGLFGHQVPQMAHLGLADAVNAAEALLDAVGIPRQVVVHHQVGALKVDAFTGGVRGEQHLHFGVVLERFLHLQSVFAADAAVNDDHGLLAPEQRGDAAHQVVERVAVLGEDDELLVRRRRGALDLARAIRCVRFSHAVGDRAGGEDFAEEACQLTPLGVGAAAANTEGECLQALQRLDLGPQLGDAASRRCLVENFFLGGFDLVVRRVFEVLDILGIEHGRNGRHDGRGLPAALQHFELAQPALQPLASATQRLIDRFG